MSHTLADDQACRLTEASAWRVALSETDRASSGEFEAWLARDIRNEEAWERVQCGWSLIGEQASSSELLALRRDALARAHRHSTRRWAGAVAPHWKVAASLLAFICVGLFYTAKWPASEPMVYATQVGERRVITLVDGSKVSLDSSSRVQIDYSNNARRLELTGGQARFDVAHDAARPFSVRAKDQLVIATGTAFNVDIVDERVKVTLIEGKVVVVDVDESAGGTERAHKSSAPGTAVTLAAGQQLIAAPTMPARIETVNLDRSGAWERGQLVFEDETLGRITAMMSRYATRPVRVEPGVANLRVSGVLNAGDATAFADTVERYLPVDARKQPDGSILLKSRR